MTIGVGSRADLHDHLVQFYDDSDHLVHVVARYLGDALTGDGAALIIASRAHRGAFEDALGHLGVDVESARAAGRLVVVDAAEALGLFMRDGSPDPDVFEDVIGGLVERTIDAGRPVRAFGEMVALLWAEGNVGAAMELEDLWNGIGRQLPFTLLCAYPADALAGEQYAAAVAGLCDLHTGVLCADGVLTSSGGNGGRTHVRAENFPAAYSAPAAARRLVENTLTAWGYAHLSDAARLVVTELATNAVKHAGTDFSVSVAELTTRVRITVRDGSTTAPELGQAGWLAGSGRGLSMVAVLADRWGHDIAADGKAVWAELPADRRSVRD